MVLLVCRITVSICCPSGEQLALPVCWSGTSLSIISRVFVPIFFSGQSVVVDVEGVGSMILITKTSDLVCVCVCVCVFIKLHITAQSGPVIYSSYATEYDPPLPGKYLS